MMLLYFCICKNLTITTVTSPLKNCDKKEKEKKKQEVDDD